MACLDTGERSALLRSCLLLPEPAGLMSPWECETEAATQGGRSDRVMIVIPRLWSSQRDLRDRPGHILLGKLLKATRHRGFFWEKRGSQLKCWYLLYFWVRPTFAGTSSPASAPQGVIVLIREDHPFACQAVTGFSAAALSFLYGTEKWESGKCFLRKKAWC